MFRGGSSYEETLINSNPVQDDLSNSGFVCNMVKPQWVPGQVGEHLGFVANFREGTLTVLNRENEN